MARSLAAPLLAVLLAFSPFFAAAQQAVPAEDARAVRAVVEAQIEAFRRDDAAQAFSLAAPGIRERFGDAATFLEMVRRSYAVVYRPQSVTFEAPLLVDGELVQPVHLTDAQGRDWIAIYPMQRQPDGSWRTNGCQLARLAGTRT
jgi:DNA-binding transcriptional LysR family regulator